MIDENQTLNMDNTNISQVWVTGQLKQIMTMVWEWLRDTAQDMRQNGLFAKVPNILLNFIDWLFFSEGGIGESLKAINNSFLCSGFLKAWRIPIVYFGNMSLSTIQCEGITLLHNDIDYVSPEEPSADIIVNKVKEDEEDNLMWRAEWTKKFLNKIQLSLN